MAESGGRRADSLRDTLSPLLGDLDVQQARRDRASDGVEDPQGVAVDDMGMRPNHNVLANSMYLQKAFASCICFGVRHSASNNRGDATITQRHLARDVATLSRFA